MFSRPLARLLLATLLTTGIGAATAATPALAESPGHRTETVAAKKRKKKPTVKVATNSLGTILVAANGKTVYAFDLDGTDPSTSHCTGGCSGLWPPLVSKSGKVVAGKGLDLTKLTVGVANQVAYDGHLLYFYAPDTAAGDTGGQGVGGLWHVVGADGNTIT
jgi:predicted lipoprotein with Yx(FWY)xxD motif